MGSTAAPTRALPMQCRTEKSMSSSSELVGAASHPPKKAPGDSPHDAGCSTLVHDLQIVRPGNIADRGRPASRHIERAGGHSFRQATKIGSILHDPDQPDPDPEATDGRPESLGAST